MKDVLSDIPFQSSSSMLSVFQNATFAAAPSAFLVHIMYARGVLKSMKSSNSMPSAYATAASRRSEDTLSAPCPEGNNANEARLLNSPISFLLAASRMNGKTVVRKSLSPLSRGFHDKTTVKANSSKGTSSLSRRTL